MGVDVAKPGILLREVLEQCRQYHVFHDIGEIAGVVSVSVTQHAMQLANRERENPTYTCQGLAAIVYPLIERVLDGSE